jgi:preprotein translocase subunit SecA
MGLFSFFTSVKQPYTDKVWKTRGVAMKGMITEALKSITQNQVPVVVCYFADRITEVISFLTTAGVPYFYLTDDTIELASSQRNVVLVSNTSLVNSSTRLAMFFQSVSKTNKLHFLFAGHYPLPSKENKVIEKLSASFPASTITFCSSIDDPSFELFGADRIMILLDKLGMEEEECIEHAMVSKAMARAREKIEVNVKHEIVSETEKEWFLKNLKK